MFWMVFREYRLKYGLHVTGWAVSEAGRHRKVDRVTC